MADRRHVTQTEFDQFQNDLREAIEAHLPTFAAGSGAANDRAWDIAQHFAWRLWSEMLKAPAPPVQTSARPVSRRLRR